MLAALKFCFASLVLLLNTLLFCGLMLPFALLKLLLPLTAVRRVLDRVLIGISATWIDINSGWLRSVNRGAWHVSGLDGLRPDAWYLVTCNHQSWVDIVVIQRVLNRRIPMLKFFLKKELIYVPILGLAWWALDFPFMRRGSGGGSARKDLRDARQACEKFRLLPTSVMSFAEGTRFTAAKHAEQPAPPPYQHLLAPKAGGMGMAPSADIGDDHALFQPAHGTAPDIVGQGIANPSATILSAAMMLDWLAQRHGDSALADAARAIENALAAAFAKGTVRPREFGGRSSTADIVRATIDGL